MKLTGRSAALILGLAVAISAHGEIYKWKDKDGKVHFSDIPPPGQSNVQTPSRRTPAVPDEPATEEDSEATGPEEAGKPSTPAAPKNQANRDEEFRKRRAAAAEAREKADKEAARTAQRKDDCRRARAQHAALTGGLRVARPTEDGNRVLLNDDERAAELQRAQELIKSFCDE